MLDEVLEHINDGCSSARGHALLGAPGVDFLDQLGLDPKVDICSIPSHAREVGRCRAPLLDNLCQKIDASVAGPTSD